MRLRFIGELNVSRAHLFYAEPILESRSMHRPQFAQPRRGGEVEPEQFREPRPAQSGLEPGRQPRRVPGFTAHELR